MSKELLFLKVCSFKRRTKIPNPIRIFFFKSIFNKMRRTLPFLKFNFKTLNLKVEKNTYFNCNAVRLWLVLYSTRVRAIFLFWICYSNIPRLLFLLNYSLLNVVNICIIFFPCYFRVY